MARELEEEELIRRAIEGRLLDLRTSVAGEVVDFDANTMTATIKPTICFQGVDPDTVQAEVDELEDLQEVPVQFPKFGEFIIFAPLTAGNIGRLHWSEEDDGDIYRDEGASIPACPRVLKRHGGHAVFVPSGFRGDGALGSEDPTKFFLGIPGGSGIQMSTTETKLGDSSATELVALASLVEAAIAAAISGHTHTGVTTGGGSTGNGVLAGSVQSTAAQKVKAK